MKLTLEEVEQEIIECVKEMDAFEYNELHARIKKSPLADGYRKAFNRAGFRLNRLRLHRCALEQGSSWRS